MVHKGAAEDSTTPVVEEEEVVDEVATISSRAAVEVMREEVEAEVGEETTVEVKRRVTGRTALAEVDTRVITRTVDIEEEEEEEEATKEASRDRATKEASKDQGTQEEDIRVEVGVEVEVGVTSMRATIRTEDDTRRGEEGVGAGVEEEEEEEEEEVGRGEEDGVEEEGRIIPKEGNLSNSFSKVGNSITRPALAREDSLRAENRLLLRSTASKRTHNSLRVGDRERRRPLLNEQTGITSHYIHGASGVCLTEISSEWTMRFYMCTVGLNGFTSSRPIKLL